MPTTTALMMIAVLVSTRVVWAGGIMHRDITVMHASNSAWTDARIEWCCIWLNGCVRGSFWENHAFLLACRSSCHVSSYVTVRTCDTLQCEGNGIGEWSYPHVVDGWHADCVTSTSDWHKVHWVTKMGNVLMHFHLWHEIFHRNLHWGSWRQWSESCIWLNWKAGAYSRAMHAAVRLLSSPHSLLAPHSRSRCLIWPRTPLP